MVLPDVLKPELGSGQLYPDQHLPLVPAQCPICVSYAPDSQAAVKFAFFLIDTMMTFTSNFHIAGKQHQ